MKLGEIVRVASSAYPDNYLMEYFDVANDKPIKNEYAGDSLAQTIVFDIASVYDEDVTDAIQLEAIVTALKRMEKDVANVGYALNKWLEIITDSYYKGRE